MCHDASERRSPPRFIVASLMVVYSAGTDMAPKGKHRQRKASFPAFTMRVEIICAFV